MDAISDGEDAWSSAASWSTSRRPASTRATPRACCRRTRSDPEITDEISAATKAMALELRRHRPDERAVRRSRTTEVYVIEVNPRASRTVPFVSKATGVPLAKHAAKVMCRDDAGGARLHRARSCRRTSASRRRSSPSTSSRGRTSLLSPEMRSTGEVMGIDADLGIAFLKAYQAAGHQAAQGGAHPADRQARRTSAPSSPRRARSSRHGLRAARHRGHLARPEAREACRARASTRYKRGGRTSST